MLQLELKRDWTVLRPVITCVVTHNNKREIKSHVSQYQLITAGIKKVFHSIKELHNWLSTDIWIFFLPLKSDIDLEGMMV